MRVIDTATILAAMAQVSPRARRTERVRVVAPTVEAPAPALVETAGSLLAVSSGARTRACHRPPATPATREPGDHEDGPRRVPRSALVVVPQGVIPVIVLSSRLAAASRVPGC